MKTFITTLIIILTFISCTENKSSKTTVSKIDDIVKSILDSSQVYDIGQSPLYSRQDEQYNVVSYDQNDTTKLFVETIKLKNKEYTRQLYFNQSKLIYASEIGYEFDDTTSNEYIINTYFLGDGTQINYKNENSTDIFSKDYKLIPENTSIELSKANDAIKQQGDFEMKFGEFLVAGPQTYLILSNEKSKYDIALFIQKGDFLLDELYSNPDKYKGKTIFSNHEFIKENGISKMAYRGGILIEK